MITVLASCVFISWRRHCRIWLLEPFCSSKVKAKPDVWCPVWSLIMPKTSPVKERDPFTIKKKASFLHLCGPFVLSQRGGRGGRSAASARPSQSPLPGLGLGLGLGLSLGLGLGPGALPAADSRSGPSSFCACGFSGRGRCLKKRKKCLQKIKIITIVI